MRTTWPQKPFDTPTGTWRLPDLSPVAVVVGCFPAAGACTEYVCITIRHGHADPKWIPDPDPMDLDPRSTGVIDPSPQFTAGSTGIIDPNSDFVVGSGRIIDPRKFSYVKFPALHRLIRPIIQLHKKRNGYMLL